MLLQNRQENEKVKLSVIELYELEQKYKQVMAEYRKKKEKLTTFVKNFMFCNKGMDNGFHFLAQSGDMFGKENQMLKVSKITPSTVEWDVNALEESVGRKRSKKVINKTYTINDYAGLVKYLKSCGVNPETFKTFINVEKNVNVNALNQLYELGEVGEKETKGCYKVRHKTSYLRISITENPESEV